MNIVSVNGTTLASLGGKGLINNRSVPSEVEPIFLPRSGQPPILVSGNGLASQWEITFNNADGGGPLDRGGLLAAFEVDSGKLVEIVATPPGSADQYAISGVATRWRGAPGGVILHFTVPSPLWRAVTESSDLANAISSSGDSFTVSNTGHARAYPIYKVTPTVQRTTESTDVGWKWLGSVTIINNETRPETRETKFIDMGDTTPLTTAKALASGDDVRVFQAGRELPRSLINWDTGRTFLAVVVSVPALSSITLDIVYGNPDAGSPPTISSQGDARTMPERFTALDLFHANGTATSGASNTLTMTGAGWTADRFRGGMIQILSGTGSGQRRRILSNTATVLTVSRNWTTNPAAGSVFVIWMSGLYANGGAASSGTTTTLTDSSQSFGTNSLIGGMLTNVTKGESRTIRSNTVTVVTIDGTMTAPSVSDVYYIERRGFHPYAVGQFKRSSTTTATLPSGDVWLGGWYQDARFSRPGVVSTAADGIANAWDRYVMLRNADDFGNARTYPVDVGGGGPVDIDYFNGLDADRRVGQDRRLSEEGTADGVTITNPHGYIGAFFDYQQKNPNGITAFLVASRTDGGSEWNTVVEDATTRATLTAVAAAHRDLSDFSEYATPLHLYMGVVPADPDEQGNIPSTASPRDTATVRWYQRLELFQDITNWSVGALSAETAVYDLNARLKLAALAADPPYDQIEFGGDGHRIFVPIDQTVWFDTDPDATTPTVALYDGAALIAPIPHAATAYRYLETQIGEAVATMDANAGSLPPGDTEVVVIEEEIGSLSIDVVFRRGYLG